ncbi:MAG: cellulase family glycosylhydrolase [Eubacteriales bacterium]|nr:cellulase family glycosylhydrolase [Eubacteriales bacterium]
MKKSVSVKRLLATGLIVALLFSVVSFSDIRIRAADQKITTEPTMSQAQKDIVAAMGPGWNLGNQMESVNSWSGSTPIVEETAWGNPKVTRNLISTIRKAGFKTVRIPVSFLTHIGDKEDGYPIDEEWLARIKEIVEYVTVNGMYAVINIHGDGYSTVKGGWLLPYQEDQTEIKAKYQACWEQIANYFKDKNDKLIFESMNEVGADADTENKKEIAAYYENINAYNQIFVDTVRRTGGNNASRWLLIPGLNTNAELTAEEYGFAIPADTYRSPDIPDGEQRIMISVHYYAPWSFCGQENYSITQYGLEAEDSMYAAPAQAEEEMAEHLKGLYDRFCAKGYPVVIGEYGCVDKSQVKAEDVKSGKFSETDADQSNNKYRAYYAQALNTLALRYSCVPIYWDNGYNGAFGTALFDRTSKEVTQPEILEGIMAPFVEDDGKAEDITLSQNAVKMHVGDAGVRISAVVTPEDAQTNISWSSTNPEVANVSLGGLVTAKKVGTTAIVAEMSSGKTKACIVQVLPAQEFRARLFANVVEGGWNYIDMSSKEYVTLNASETESTHTLSISMSKERMQNINTLYIKDILGNSEDSEASIVSSADVIIDNVSINGKSCELTKDTFVFDSTEKAGKDIFDICLINKWDETYVDGYNNGRFPDEYYVDGINEICVTFTVKNPVMRNTDFQEIPASSLDISRDILTLGMGQSTVLTAEVLPQNSTEKAVWVSDNHKVASVDANGVVTAHETGTVTLRALTVGGQEKTCVLTVQADPVELEPTPSQTPDINATPDVEPSQTPPANPSQTPNIKPSQAPGTNQGSGTNIYQNQNQQSNGDNKTGQKTNSVVKKVKVKAVTLKKVSSSKKRQILVKWKKGKGVTGYQIRICTNKKFTKNKKTVVVKKAATVKKTIKKLKSKKKYYVKIRAYKISNGEKYYSQWSKVKKVKVK